MPGMIYFFVTKYELRVVGLHHLADFLGVDNAEVGMPDQVLAKEIYGIRTGFRGSILA
jgi:hypothetical protein